MIVVLYCVDDNRVGPLDSQLQYSVTAAKEGFVFTPTDNGIVGHFRSFKLGKIQVHVSVKTRSLLVTILCVEFLVFI